MKRANQRPEPMAVLRTAVGSSLNVDLAKKHGLRNHTSPTSTFEAIEDSLRKAGLPAELSVGRNGDKRIVIQDGLGRAEVGDFTEDPAEIRFAVTNGRKGLLSAIVMWPIDGFLVRRVERHLVADGARPLAYKNEQKG